MAVREYIMKFYNEYLIIKKPCHWLNFTVAFIGGPLLIPNPYIHVNRKAEKIQCSFCWNAGILILDS